MLLTTLLLLSFACSVAIPSQRNKNDTRKRQMRPQIGTYIINTINVGIRGQFMMETKCSVIALKACPYDATTTRAIYATMRLLCLPHIFTYGRDTIKSN